MVERIDGDVNVLANFFSQFAIDLLGNLALMAGVLALLTREDWRLGLGMALFALVALAVLLRIRAFAEPYQAADREASAQFFGFLRRAFGGDRGPACQRCRGLHIGPFHRTPALLVAAQAARPTLRPAPRPGW